MMKAFLIICDQELQPEMDFLLRANKIEQFSLFTHVQGKGESGLKTGDSIGPGLNHAYWIVVKESLATPFLKELKEFKHKKLKNKGIQVFILPVEESF
ncbi:MAG: hypothetical protein A2Z91_07210 [Deltaproteobacteria bacterium GWA2_38_16]|nr:MAG: hypothetical protein A2Z91_07210 [Deltaproteobacteria bacterium GWA2_38_16]OGQ02698.1 MAG: hypothetical protein A3D19_00545 [Deltaproteobacteria bacterium RIFCSPHIGHO2_02_FULL_38_15]OGQ34057.1 MAG: hypothetical protein A3A72_00920 [Deltaproteobacteria bacterium RIFCSPLOWO2_01_FULL_38_9]OGQ59042.1 MAG: hypothetical protein A3G92_05075 [Deltaproteobacteria bacterium RIFCSPLOWO2_12_FULL_38_8]HBQ20555.1 hypothetical protein [Deltaproteobacteria bacterium]